MQETGSPTAVLVSLRMGIPSFGMIPPHLPSNIFRTQDSLGFHIYVSLPWVTRWVSLDQQQAPSSHVLQGWLAVVVYPLPMPLNMFAIVAGASVEQKLSSCADGQFWGFKLFKSTFWWWQWEIVCIYWGECSGENGYIIHWSQREVYGDVEG